MQQTHLRIRYGHVKHHDHTATEAYLRRQAPMESVTLSIVASIRWVSADRYAESPAADLFGGFLKAATWPSGQFGYVEPSYLLDVWQCIRKSESCVIPLGLMCMPESYLVTREPWFPCDPCKRIGSRSVPVRDRPPARSTPLPLLSWRFRQTRTPATCNSRVRDAERLRPVGRGLCHGER